MKFFFHRAFLVFLLLTAYAHAEGERACRFPQSPSYEGNIFEPSTWPVTDLEAFSSGRLGVIRPTYDHFYLFIAHRVLSGLAITPDDVERLRRHDPCWHNKARNYGYNYDPTREEVFQAAQHQWREQRDKITEIPSPGEISGMRMSVGGYQEYFNCYADAFRTAAKALEARLAAYGHTPAVLDWVRAQDRVFANCKSPAVMPDDAPPSAPRWLHLDRDYQQAAALFYAGQYDDAIKRFDAIAATSDSPWQEIAPYLAARALIRSAQPTPPDTYISSTLLGKAEARLKNMLDKNPDSPMRKDMERLLQYAQLRTDPETVLGVLEKRFAAEQLPASIGQDVTDFWMAYRENGEAGPLPPFSLWLRTLRGNDPAPALEQWQKSRTLPWLVAALQLAKTDTPELAVLLSAAEQVPTESPAYVTAQYHLARLARDDRTALRIVDKILNLPATQRSIQDVNAFKRIGVARATTLTEFARYAPRQSAMKHHGILPNLDDDSVDVFNQGLPLDDLVKVHAMKELPDAFRRELSIVIWTRAFVLKRRDLSRQFTPAIKRLLPESAKLIDDMLKAPDEKTRQAVGAMLMARYPGLVGNMTSSITYTEKLDQIALANMHQDFKQESSRNNWWCSFPESLWWARKPPAEIPQEPEPPAFLSTQALAALRDERKELRTIVNATDYLSDLVLAWAKKSPRDPRLPQALHMLIRSSRGGCVDANSSGAMFRHLHKYFPTSHWAKITRVHYPKNLS